VSWRRRPPGHALPQQMANGAVRSVRTRCRTVNKRDPALVHAEPRIPSGLSRFGPSKREIPLKFLKNNVRGIVACLVVAASVLVGTTIPASAANTGELFLCSYGDYDSYVEFPSRGYSSKIVGRGQCSSIYVGNGNKVETIVIIGITYYGYYFWVANGSLNLAEGGNAATYGSLNSHWATTPQT